MDDGAGLVMLIVIVAIIGAVIAAILSVGWIILGVIAAYGAIAGIIVGLNNFVEVLTEGHNSMPFSFRVPIQDMIEKIFQKQPAKVMYAFGAGWQVMKYVKDNVFLRTEPDAKADFKKAETQKINASIASSSIIKYYYYCAYLGFLLAAALRYVMAYIIVGTFCIVQFLILLTWMGIVAVIVGLLSAWNYLFSFIYRIFFRCPDCHEQMLIPVFICPTCATEHTRLWPSVYGVFNHTCEKCSTNLPTLDFTGRTKIPRRCSVCNHPMNAAIGQQINIHIPVVGGPNTGKSNYIFQATRLFIEEYAPPRSMDVTFPDEKHLLNYQTNIGMLSSGKELDKTHEIVPQAYNLSIKKRFDRIGRIIYLYDAAGEAYRADVNTEMQKPYFDYIHGIIFVIDPFAIEAFAALHKTEIEEIEEWVRPSKLSIMDGYSRMISVLEASFGVKNGQKFPHPLAVVVTKSDALNLEDMIGSRGAIELMKKDPAIRCQEDAIDCLVESFLLNNNMGNLVRNIHMQFAKVRFFSCSALGRLPDPSCHEGYVPFRVLDPFTWVLGEVGVVNTARERAKKMDERDWKAAVMHGNTFKKARYYFWESLIPKGR